MVIKYRTNRRGAPLGLSILLAVFVVLAATGPNTSHKTHDILVFIAYCGLLSLWFFFGIFILTNDVGIYTVDFFLFQRGMAYADIQEVWYYQAYITGGRTRILAIKGTHNGRDKVVKLGGNKFSSEQTLSDIVFLIQKRNPNIQLDGASEELMRSRSGFVSACEVHPPRLPRGRFEIPPKGRYSCPPAAAGVFFLPAKRQVVTEREAN